MRNLMSEMQKGSSFPSDWHYMDINVTALFYTWNRDRFLKRETNLKLQCQDFPGGLVVKNPFCNAGDASSIPGQGTKIPHARGQLSPRHNYRACALCSPHTTTKDPACRNQDPTQPKNK